MVTRTGERDICAVSGRVGMYAYAAHIILDDLSM